MYNRGHNAPLARNIYHVEEIEDFRQNWPNSTNKNGESAKRKLEDGCQFDYYFSSYNCIGIHEEMLNDRIRTGIYHKAILSSPHLFKDKVVLDVGSGTGILSFFCIQAGAKHVYAIEYSDIISISLKLAEHNGLSDRITFIQGQAENVTLPVEEVDIIISEWMGYLLLYENMLATVITCRDRWLKPGGLIFPDKARLYITAIEDSGYKENRMSSLKDLYGLDFSLITPLLIEEPLIDFVDRNSLVTTTNCVLNLDIYTCSESDLDFCGTFLLIAQRDATIHGFTFWFDVSFTVDTNKTIVLSTSPYFRNTHWKQSVVYICDNVEVQQDDVVKGMVAIRRNGVNPRNLDIKLMYERGNERKTTRSSQVYYLK